MFTAHRLENIYSKDDILTLYLNTVSFGKIHSGIECRSKNIFNLCFRSDYPSGSHVDRYAQRTFALQSASASGKALNRRNTVIDQMMKYDYLDEETGEKIKQEELQLHYIPVNHFPVWLLIYAKKYAGMPTGSSKNTTKKYGTNYNLYKDGLILKTTLDAEMQQYAENAVQGT